MRMPLRGPEGKDQEGRLNTTRPILTAGTQVSDPDRLRYVPSAYKKVAGELESQFNQLMLEQMGKTVDRTEEESTAESYYEALLTAERAKAMSAGEKGLGIKKMVLDQIYPKRLRNETNFMAQEGTRVPTVEISRAPKIKIYAQGGQHEQH